MWKSTEHLQQASRSRSSTPPSSASPHHHSNSGSPDRTQRLWQTEPQQTPRQVDHFETPTSHTPVSTISDSQSDVLSPDATDRVFPIRSVVSVDPTATPSVNKGSRATDGFPGLTGSIAGSDRRSGSRLVYTSSAASEADSVDLYSRKTPSQDGASRNRRTSESTGPDTRKPLALRESGTPLMDKGHLHSCIGEEPPSPSVQSRDSRSVYRSAKSVADEEPNFVTARFKHTTTREGHAVITGRGGNTLQRCEDEPIHIPGAVQGFGLLIALQEVNDGKLQVRVASENSTRIIGFTPNQLFELDSFCDIMTEEQADNLLDHVDFVRDEDVDPVTNGPEVFTMAIRSPSGKNQKLWCAIHMNGNNKGLIVCEFELEDDPLYPLVPHGEGTPEPPEDTLNSDPTPQEYEESTINISRPLRVLRSARKRKGEAAAMEVFNIMSQVQEQLSRAPSLEGFLRILVGVVKELTGFHRVMVYQFDASWNGRVVSELVDPRATKDLYKGLNFPASDIPKQARDLYKINKVRLLYDRDQETARLVCRTVEDLETPLDLTHAYLRAMSPIHIKYLANMAVRASMSISINAFNELWGLISCHSYGSKGMRVSFPIRKMCRLVGDSASQNIERLSYASRLHARKLINTVPTSSNPSGYIIASSDDLLSLFDADCGLLSIRDETKILGKLEHTQEALAMLEYLRLRKFGSVTKSTDIKFDFPDLRYGPGFSFIAGLMLVPLSVGGSDFIVFFRKGQVREVKWAGNPYEKFVKEGTEGYLEPRKSFKTWSETVVGKCKDWTEEQTETAAVLCLVYGKFIEVWKQKEVALQNSQFTKLLLANSAHEVRTPLNAIINYLEIAMEGSLDSETRDNLTRSYSASKSLIYVINDLLDLTKTEEGGNLIKDEIFDLSATVQEATDSFANDAKRKGLEYKASQNAGIPQCVVGDSRRVRQAVSNIVTNAIQHTYTGSIEVGLWLANASEDRVDIDLVVQDTGCGMAPEKLDALFRELEQVQTADDAALEESFAVNKKHIDDKDTSKRTLGLGLAVVARIIRNMNGQMRVKSEEGKGSRFILQFVFDLPAREDEKRALEEANAAGVGPPIGQPTTPPVELGEVLLVNKSAQKQATPRPSEVIHRKSTESVRSTNSLKSFKSGTSAKSDVDRLIEAIQEPSMTSRSENDHVRPISRGQVSTGSPSFPIRRSFEENPGTHAVTDSKTPIKPVRIAGESSLGSSVAEHGPAKVTSKTASRVLFDIPDQTTKPERNLTTENLKILVGEDDPINSKIIKKRLEKLNHDVYLTINGEECSSAFGERPNFFDVILMDMQVRKGIRAQRGVTSLTVVQMPIVDGLTSTKMIRSFEKTNAQTLSQRAALNGRVPVVAVSASLVEKDRQIYVDAGFDAWILKPIDIKRLSVLLSGIVDDKARQECLYQPGQWEKGGWFCKRSIDVFSAETSPSPAAAVPSSQKVDSCPVQPQESASDRERARLGDLQDDAVHAKSSPSEPGSSGNVQQSLEGEGGKEG